MLYIVTFKEEKDLNLIREYEGKIVYNYSFLPKIIGVELTQANAEKLESNDAVESVEEDETEYDNAQEESYALDVLKAYDFFDSSYTGKGVKVAVLDSGCQIHEDLKITGGYNSFDPEKPYMIDIGDHGTHTAGIINMQDNDVGYLGVAPDAQLYVVKMEDNQGTGYKVSSQIEAINWAIENEMDIVSQSVSGSSDIKSRREAYRVAAEEHGIIICASSGNGHRGHGYTDDTIGYPAKYSFIVGCGATLKNNEIRPSSSRGEGLDIVAPGTSIMSTVTSKTTELGNEYASKSGTSMSTPFVAGMFALYKEKYPHLNRENLIEMVMNNAKYLGDPLVYGAGMIQPPSDIKQEDARSPYVRDLKGNEYVLQATMTNEYELNGNQSLSFTVLPTKVNKEFISDISEMWEVVDFDGVEYKIVYAKRKGKGSHVGYELKQKRVTSDEDYFLSANQTAKVSKLVDTHEKSTDKLLSVDIKAIPLFFDALDNDRIYQRYDEHMTAKKAFTRIFEGTGFGFLLVDTFSAVDWEGFGEGETKLETFKRALERYKAEFRISGNVVYLEKQIGRDTQFMYRHRLNASNIEQEINAEEMWTYSKGYGDYGDGEGSEDWQNAKLTREYTSPLAKVIGIRHAPPVKNGNITTRKEMDRRLKEVVNESLKISVTADIHDLREQGYPIAQSELGDRVFIIDERIDLDEEIRVVEQTLTRNWKGKVVDLSISFGNEGISKRYQSNLNTAAKDIKDLFDGVKQLPYSVLDERVKNATKALRDAQTELDFTNNGILAIDKRNPNLMTILNSAGLGVSRDGGATYENAITGEGINASVITAGVIHGITIDGVEIYGGMIDQSSGSQRIVMQNGKINSYNDGDLSMSFGQYSLDFYNRSNSRIGRLIPLQWSADPNTKGMGLIVDEDFINIGYQRGGSYHAILRSSMDYQTTTLTGPYKNLNEGSSLRLFANRRQVSEGRYSVTDQPSILLDQSDNTNDVDVYFGGFNNRSNAKFRVIHNVNATQHSTRFEVTSSGPSTTGNMSAYDFVKPSSRDFKQNIRENMDFSSLDVINRLKVVEFEYKDTADTTYSEKNEKRLGFISEDNPDISTPNKKAISDVKLSSHLTRAVQELSKKVEALEVQHGQ